MKWFRVRKESRHVTTTLHFINRRDSILDQHMRGLSGISQKYEQEVMVSINRFAACRNHHTFGLHRRRQA